MGNFTKVHKANHGGTLETTIPAFAANMMGIREGDRMEWSIETAQGLKVLQLRKVDALGSAV